MLLRLSISALLILFMTGMAYAQEEDQMTLEEYKKKEKENFKQYKADVTRALEEYAREQQEAIAKLKREIETYWGENNFKMSTKKDWVEYSKDKKTRTDVDFEDGTAKVEILVSPEEAENPELVKDKLKDAVEDLATTQGQTKDYETENEKPEKLMDDPVLEGQLQTSEGETVDEGNADDYAEEVAENEDIEMEEVQGTDGQKRIKVSVSLPLAPDHIKVRANKFKDHIRIFASRFKLPPELVYAVIHTESYFNPKARSYVPAYGLMQIVPKYAGRDAYLFLYKQDKLLNANYLYQADKNIELGTAYLNLLMNRDFDDVEDDDCRMLCAIAAYNTGAGNVSKTFTGKTNLKKAIAKINSYNYRQLFDYLHRYLPYKETRDYITRVSSRMKKYEDWKGH